MGMVYAHAIKKAAEYLLVDVLCYKIAVRFSHFYDGTEGTQVALAEALGYKESDGELFECAALLIELAAHQLEAQSFVKITELEDKLANDEQDYLIELTEEGTEKMMAGEEPAFRDLYL